MKQKSQHHSRPRRSPSLPFAQPRVEQLEARLQAGDTSLSVLLGFASLEWTLPARDPAEAPAATPVALRRAEYHPSNNHPPGYTLVAPPRATPVVSAQAQPSDGTRTASFAPGQPIPWIAGLLDPTPGSEITAPLARPAGGQPPLTGLRNEDNGLERQPSLGTPLAEGANAGGTGSGNVPATADPVQGAARPPTEVRPDLAQLRSLMSPTDAGLGRGVATGRITAGPNPTNVNTRAPQGTTFGFNYWPAGQSNNCLTNAIWPTVRAQVAADFDQMVSLNSGVLRILFWPGSGSWTIRQGGGGSFTSGYYEQLANLPDFLHLASDRNLQVIVTFGNSYLTYDATPGQKWWQWAYGADNWAGFLTDSIQWMSGYVNAIESSPYRSAVLYYDYQNEVYGGTLNMWPYVTGLYDNVPVPLGKRGISFLHYPADVASLSQALGSRPLDYVDFHSYPAQGENADIEGVYDGVRGYFPNSTVVMGEFGSEASSPAAEDAQQATDLDLINRAIVKGIPYVLNWQLWDQTPNPGLDYGFAYDHDDPKNVMGGVSSLLSLVDNPDMEIVSGTVPAGWSAGSDGSVPPDFLSMGPSRADAATNGRYARLIVNDANTTGVWIVSDLTPVSRGGALFLNSYVRSSNLAGVAMVVTEYDAQLQEINQQYGPAFTPSGWSWNDYLSHAGAWEPVLSPATRYITVGVAAGVTEVPAILDVDTVSVHGVPREGWRARPLSSSMWSSS